MSATAISVMNPATGAVIDTIEPLQRHEFDEIVARAVAAQEQWRATPIAERRQAIVDLADRMLEQAEMLAALLTAEQGKPLPDALGEVKASAGWMKAIAARDIPVTILEDSATRRVEQHHVPIGVVGAIAPWNFPLILGLWKVAPALLAGNTVLLKPSPFTPLATARVGDLARGIFPDDVFTVVLGGDELGPWMTQHSGIGKISFTGSTATGKKVMASAAENLTRVTLELGGNDPAIVLPDVDIDAVVPDIFWAAFRNSGQVCMASKRIYVHSDIYEAFRATLEAYAATIAVGDGAHDGVRLGPVQNRMQYDRVRSIIEDCRTQGYPIAYQGDAPGSHDGNFIPVTIVDNPPDSARVVVEEAFGPVVPLLRYDDYDEVVRRANDSVYGLSASIWGQDLALAHSIARRLEAGIVWLNECQAMSPNVPFAGRKQSGLGVESGIEGLLEYTAHQIISTRVKPAA